MLTDAVKLRLAGDLGRSLGFRIGPSTVTHMPAKKAAAAKSSPAEERRTRAFTVRMTPEEADVIERAARSRALEVASWIRMVAFEAAKAQLGKT